MVGRPVALHVPPLAAIVFDLSKRRAAAQAQSAASSIARRRRVLLRVGSRLRHFGRSGGQRASALRQPNAVGAILDQAEHLETQALRR